MRKPHTSTSDLLTWSEIPPAESPSTVSGTPSRSGPRSHQPSDRISKVLSGDQVTDDEADSFQKRKPCSGYKLKEMTGSGIFASNGEDSASESGSGLRVYQQVVNGMSQISFSGEESVSPKKPASLPEVAKQRELSGTMETDSDSNIKKQLSDAKTKELSGHDIFGPPPEIKPRTFGSSRTSLDSTEIKEPTPRNLRTSVKVSNSGGGQSNIFFNDEATAKTSKKIHNQKFAELTGNDIFKGDVLPGSAEKPLSTAKLREMNGSDIFADGKAESRDYLGGVRKPPGGESSIALV